MFLYNFNLCPLSNKNKNKTSVSTYTHIYILDCVCVVSHGHYSKDKSISCETTQNEAISSEAVLTDWNHPLKYEGVTQPTAISPPLQPHLHVQAICLEL